MPRYLALLRGVNVGGHNRVPMAALRELAGALGHTDVVTYIQSGNLLFSSARRDPADLATQLEAGIAARLGVNPAVVVLSRDEFAQVVADNPYPDEADPRKLHAVFTGDRIDDRAVDVVSAAVRSARERGSQDAATVVRRTMFVHTPGGFGRSELAVQLSRAQKQGAPVGTARNWATVTTLMTMLDG